MSDKTPAKGKRFSKLFKNPETGRMNKVSYGQAGKASDGGWKCVGDKSKK